MRVLVCGATGCVGSAITQALRSRGHQVVETSRNATPGRFSLPIDFAQPTSPETWAEQLRPLALDAVVNAVGILMPSRGQSFERLHSAGPIELFRGAAQAGVRRIVQISALGVGDSPDALARPYLASKLAADDALAALPLEWAVLRPSLVYGPKSQSGALFATLASLPVISLPGRGQQAVQPIHVFELAEAAARLVEQPQAPQAVYELGGAHAMSYRDMLATYRHAMGLGAPLWLPLPMPLMRITAWVAEALPQKVFCRDTIALLERGSLPTCNAAPALLGRPPADLAQGLAITAPEPWLDLHVQLSPPVQTLLRLSIAFMWLYTAAITLLWPQASGVLNLLERCGLNGQWGLAAMVFSCTLNTVLGGLMIWRATPWVCALQAAAIVGYTATAAINMPELTLDHCGPLVKNVPVLAMVCLLWLAGTAHHTTRDTVRYSRLRFRAAQP